MSRKKFATRLLAGICTASLIVTLFPSLPKVQAASWTDDSVNQYIDAGGFKTELFGAGMYNWNKIPRTEKLPPSKVYLTDNYLETVGTVPTSDWASSIVFDQYSESLYAHPLAYRAASNGMQMATPAVVVEPYYTDQEPQVTSLLKDDTVEFVVGGEGFEAADAKVDKTTDWTYDVIMANAAGTSSMYITLAKGSPYAYYKFDNVKPTISLGAGATDMVIYKNSTSSNQIGISVLNKKDNKTHYYGIYAPNGTTWTNADGKLTASLPSGKNYISIATLPDNSDDTFNTYAKYAYNYITNTIVDWNYNENSSLVSTNYYFETTNQETGAVGGETIMALYPHQWRYAQGENFASYTYDTIRGTMKTIIGTNYTTNMTYNGALPVMPAPKSEEGIGQLKELIGYYYSYYKVDCAGRIPQWIDYGLDGSNGGYDTYWIGKNYNRISDVIMMADLLDDDDADMKAMKEEMMSEMEANLLYWFNPNEGYINEAENTYDSYFYYHAPYGTLIGYPSGFGSDYEMNDHHFHYGYWIKAAATLAMMDETGTWEQTNGGMVYEMIDDIANMNRNGESHSNIAGKTTTKYPFLRNFDIYEGHSWANGLSNYEYTADGKLTDANGGLSGGNNQESSTEAVNAWASIIFWGEAVGDDEIRDLGVYLYTTEIAAIEDYYYDIHGDIFPDEYVDASNFNLQTVTRLFGGRYDHTTWWTEDPIEATTINMLPMTGATLYLGKNKNKVKAVYDSIDADSVQWNHYLQNPGTGLQDPYMHQDILAEYYALADPETAMNMWSMEDINGVPKIEFGDSRAHTYGYIQSMIEYGTPNYEVTGSSPMSMVFEKDGKKTYVAYNYSSNAETVYFSDGTYIEVEPGTQYAGDKTGDGVNPDKGDTSDIMYYTEYYVENANGEYEKHSSTSDKVTSGTKVEAEEMDIAGYTLDKSHASTIASGTVIDGTTLTLKLYYSRNTYNINFVLNGGGVTGTLPTTFKYGEEVELPTPIKSGYTFEGWYSDEAFTSVATSTGTATGDLTLYAKYNNSSTVSGITLSDSAITLLVGGKQKLTVTILPETATNKNVTWSTSDTSVATVDAGLVTAIKKGTATITVTTTDGGYTATCQVTVKEESSVPLEAAGVRMDSEGNVITYVTDQPNAGSIVAYGRVYDTLEEASSAVLNNLSGYNMSKNSDGVWEYNFGSMDDSKYFVYAFNYAGHDTPIVIAVKNIPSAGEQITTHVVTFETGEGSDVESQTIISGEKASEPEVPTREGYTFAGWYLNNAAYDFNTPVTSDMELVAQWTKNSTQNPPEITTVKVTGVTINKESISLKSGQTEILAATVSPSNATNKAVIWTSDAPTVAPVDVAGKVTALAAGTATITAITEDGGYAAVCVVTVTAKAGGDSSSEDNSGSGTTTTPETKSFKVTFDSVEGSAVTAQTVKEGEKAVKPEDPTRAGYKFLGWYAGETAYNFDTAVNADVTLTAKWEVIKITKVKITAISNKIAAGKKVQLKASLSPTDAVAKSVTWKLAKKSDSKYAKVTSKGKVTLKKNGAGKKVKVKATVTGLDGTVKSKTITITIKKHAVKKLSIKGSKTVNVKAGRSVSLKSRVKIATTGSSVNKTLKWTTSNEAIATVSKSGKVKVSKTAKKGQKVTIKAQSTDGTNKKVKFTIKVK